MRTVSASVVQRTTLPEIPHSALRITHWRHSALRTPHCCLLLPVRQGEAERLELQSHIDRLDHDVVRDGELDRGEVEDRLHPRMHQAIGHLLRGIRGRHEDGDVGRLALEVALDVADVAHHHAVPAGADFLRVLVVNRRHVEAALPKAGVLNQRAADPPCPDEDDAVAALKPEDAADPRSELRDGIAEAALAEGAEEGQVLANLRRRGAAVAGELGGGDGGRALRVELLEEPEVGGQPPHGASADLPHVVNYFTIPRSTARAGRTARAGASPGAPPDRARAPAVPPPRPVPALR